MYNTSGVSDSLLRLSVGIEHADDLIAFWRKSGFSDFVLTMKYQTEPSDASQPQTRHLTEDVRKEGEEDV